MTTRDFEGRAQELTQEAFTIWVGFGYPAESIPAIFSATVEKAMREAAADAWEEAAKLIQERWAFDANQQHTHTWHDMSDAVRDIRAKAAALREGRK